MQLSPLSPPLGLPLPDLGHSSIGSVTKLLGSFLQSPPLPFLPLYPSLCSADLSDELLLLRLQGSELRVLLRPELPLSCSEAQREGQRGEQGAAVIHVEFHDNEESSFLWPFRRPSGALNLL